MVTIHELTEAAEQIDNLPCRYAPDLFFVEGELESKAHILYTQAKTLCASCPLQAMCASYAIDNEAYGVWGGMTPNERREARRRSRSAA